MRIIDFGPDRAEELDAFGSVGMSTVELTHTAAATVVCLRLQAGGHIGRHDTGNGTLMYVVVAGSVTVSGRDMAEAHLTAGHAVQWGITYLTPVAMNVNPQSALCGSDG